MSSFNNKFIVDRLIDKGFSPRRPDEAPCLHCSEIIVLASYDGKHGCFTNVVPSVLEVD